VSDEPVGMFDPLPKGSKSAPPALSVVSEWRVLQPVPEDAPAAPERHPKLGAPSRCWEYRAADARLLGIVCRFEAAAGKEIRSLVFAEHKKFGRQWRWLGLPKPRPLYGLDRLAARPAAPVILCEGERAADAAGALLPDHVAMTSPGGSKAAAATDWAPLAGRKVTIWRDADEAGQGYAHAVARLLATLSPPIAVGIVNPPPGVAEGWDAADAAAEGWTPERAQGFIAGAAPPGADAAAASAPRRRKPQRDGLLALLDEVELWHDPEGAAYATVPVNDHRENYEIAADGFRNWLAWRAFEANGLAPSGQVIDDALRVAKAIAINRGPCHQTWRRVGEHDGRYYLDLGCERWRAVEIGAAGWHVVDRAPVKFLRSRGMQALPEPEAGEPIEALRQFVNVESGEKGDPDFRLLVAWLVAALRPSGPYPVLILVGQQGSAKSTLARICRLLIDPNVSPIRSVPKDERDLLVSAFNTWTLLYDNLSRVENWLSDAFCRLSTGGGFATRLLHSDRDEMIFSAQRPIALNGIGDIGTRPDLADRAISLTLPPVAEERRRPERAFWADFETARPGILGALLDAVAAGLRNLDATVIARSPRMADFAQFIAAASPGLGWTAEQFLADYADNRHDMREEAAAASPLVPVIEALLGRPDGSGAEGFDGTATELLDKLKKICTEAQQKARWFPNSASAAGTHLRRIAPLLEERSIVVDTYRMTGRDRGRRTKIYCSSGAAFHALRARFGGAGEGSAGETK
jgi:putative DNA primase/helicase